MTTLISIMIRACGLSQQEAADFLGVSASSIDKMSRGIRSTPKGILNDLRALYEKIETAADSVVEIAKAHPADTEIEIGYAADDQEAQSLGWPCVGAQLASLAIAAMYIEQPIKLVPRGSTVATAAAADAHER